MLILANMENNKQNTILALRKFFELSNATFDFAKKMQLILTGKVQENEMQKLHRLALEEISKDAPDLEKMDDFLKEMENLAENNRNK